jgi:hypothetical protein
MEIRLADFKVSQCPDELVSCASQFGDVGANTEIKQFFDFFLTFFHFKDK